MSFLADLFLSLGGRISRSRFWIGTLILTAISATATYLIIAAVGISDRAVLLSMLVAFALAYPSYALMAKRFQDRDKPGWIALFAIVPVYAINLLQTFQVIDPDTPTPLFHVLNYAAIGIGLWILLELGFFRGTQGPNRYGADPLGRARADAVL
jgi:uncharacterized membrane protein YhaH (DUF805 family)